MANTFPIVIVPAANTAIKNGQSTCNIGLGSAKPPLSENNEYMILKNKPKPAAFGAIEKKAVIGVGAPS